MVSLQWVTLLAREVAEKLTGFNVGPTQAPVGSCFLQQLDVGSSLRMPDSYSMLAFKRKSLHVLGTTGRNTIKEML